MTSSEAQREIERHLQADEKLLWHGVPRDGLVLRRSDAILIPFSLLWGGFAISWEIMTLRGGAPAVFTLFGIPFVLMGLYIIFGRFLVDARMRARTAYGLTDRRVIIVAGSRARSVTSLPLRNLSDVSLDESSDGTGTISLGPGHPMGRWLGRAAWPGMGAWQGAALDMIPSAQHVYRVLLEAQAGAR